MKSKSLLVPSDIRFDQNLNPNQKLILSLLSTEPKMFALNIAKGLGTKRSEIRDDLEALVNQHRVITTNGGNRVAYSRSKGFGYVGSEIKPALPATSSLRIKLQNNNTSINKNYSFNKLKLLVAVEDYPYFAFEYWVDNGGIQHKRNSKIFANSMDLLEKLFKGKAFTNVPNQTIPNPLLNKTKVFDLEDWKTSIDNLNLAITSVAHRPANKQGLINYKKKLTLSAFIYNPFGKEGSNRSMFLRYVEPVERLHTEVSRYKKLNRQLTKAFDRTTLHHPPIEEHIISASNKYGDFISKYQMKRPVADLADLFVEFLDKNFSKRKFKSHWITQPWWFEKLEYWFDQKGLIRIIED
jgi:hypothetical protein